MTTLEQRRLALGMSVQVLAQQSGLCHILVHHILEGKHRENVKFITAVAEVLGMEVADVVVRKIESAPVFLRQRAGILAQKVVAKMQSAKPNISYAALARLEKQTISDLLSGPRDKLW